MSRRGLWYLAKALEAIGMIVVLVGVGISIDAGMRDEGLESMVYEMRGLLAGGGLFVLGWLLETRVGER